MIGVIKTIISSIPHATKIVIIIFTMTLHQVTLSIQGECVVIVILATAPITARAAEIPRIVIAAIIMAQLIKAERLHGELFSL